MKFFSEIYGVVSFMAKSAGGIKYSRSTLAVVIVTSIVTGLSSTALVALITHGLNGNSANLQSMIWPFIGLCLVLPVSRSISSVLLNYFVTTAGMDLRMGLCRRILGPPLRLSEELGAPRILASLTDDIPAITATLASLPMLCMQLTIVLGCMGYLLWLSPKLFLILLGFVIVGVISYRLPLSKSLKLFRLYRKEWDGLFKSLQALIGGIKELKLNHRRSDALMRERVEPHSDRKS